MNTHAALESAPALLKATAGSAVGSIFALAAMTPETLGGWSLVITAATGAISAIGVILIAYLNRKVSQVEKQGNSVSLELKRTNMTYSRATAVATKKASDIAIAEEAEIAYKAAVKANDKL